VDELIDLCQSGTGYSTGELSTHLAAADGHPYVVAGSLDLLLEGSRLDELPSDPGRIAVEQWKKVCDQGEEAERLFQAHAVLEVPVPDDVVREVAELSPPEHRRLLKEQFLAGLLRQEEAGFRRLYHSLLTEHVLGELAGSAEELRELHARAAAAYRSRRNLEGKPDALALQRLPEHVLAAEGEMAFVRAVVNLLRFLHQSGLWNEAEGLLERARWTAEAAGDAAGLAKVSHGLGISMQLRGSYAEALEWYRKALEIEEELGNRAGMASSISQLGILTTEQGRPVEAVPLNLRGLAIRLEIGSPEAGIDLYWLTRQRELLGGERFRELLAEHVGEEGLEKVLELMAQYEEARRRAEASATVQSHRMSPKEVACRQVT
jgi:tetratricopeptide (TPR) repeat protein